MVCIEATRQIDDKTSTQRRYDLNLRDGRNVAAMLRTIRGHWGIENRLHGSLDVSFGEDACRVRQGHAAENFSRVRRLALNLLKHEKTKKIGIKSKSKVCSWDHDYLLKVLSQA